MFSQLVERCSRRDSCCHFHSLLSRVFVLFEIIQICFCVVSKSPPKKNALSEPSFYSAPCFIDVVWCWSWLMILPAIIKLKLFLSVQGLVCGASVLKTRFWVHWLDGAPCKFIELLNIQTKRHGNEEKSDKHSLKRSVSFYNEIICSEVTELNSKKLLCSRNSFQHTVSYRTICHLFPCSDM